MASERYEWSVYERHLIHVMYSEFDLDRRRDDVAAIFNSVFGDDKPGNRLRDEWRQGVNFNNTRSKMWKEQVIKPEDEYTEEEKIARKHARRSIKQAARNLDISLRSRPTAWNFEEETNPKPKTAAIAPIRRPQSSHAPPRLARRAKQAKRAKQQYSDEEDGDEDSKMETDQTGLDSGPRRRSSRNRKSIKKAKMVQDDDAAGPSKKKMKMTKKDSAPSASSYRQDDLDIGDTITAVPRKSDQMKQKKKAKRVSFTNQQDIAPPPIFTAEDIPAPRAAPGDELLRVQTRPRVPIDLLRLTDHCRPGAPIPAHPAHREGLVEGLREHNGHFRRLVMYFRHEMRAWRDLREREVALAVRGYWLQLEGTDHEEQEREMLGQILARAQRRNDREEEMEDEIDRLRAKIARMEEGEDDPSG